MTASEKRFSEVMGCVHCSNKAPMEIVSSYSTVCIHADEKYEEEWEAGDVYELLLCPACLGVTLRKYFYHEYMEPDDVDNRILYPAGKDVPSGLPSRIAQAYEAATKVRGIDANAYGVLLRRLIELVCIDREAAGKTLFDKLESLAKTDEIPQKLVGVAHGLRQLGNVGAHADIGELTPAELPVLDGLCKAILEYVYSAPLLAQQVEEKLAKLQAARKRTPRKENT